MAVPYMNDKKGDRCSTISFSYEKEIGGERNRTSDPGLMSPLLYQLSYAASRRGKNFSGFRTFLEELYSDRN